MSAWLSPAEFATAWLFASGWLAKQIAVRLGLSIWAVRSRIKTVYKKLGVHDRTGLIQVFEREGAL